MSAMGLPTKGTVEVIIEGKLSEMDHEPRNVQVVVVDGDGGSGTIHLRDSRGTFVEADCRVQGAGGVEVDERDTEGLEGTREAGSESPTSGEDVSAKLDEAHARNRELESLNHDLSSQVSALREELADKLKGETEKVNEVWRVSCDQVIAFDEAISAKDTDISSLKARLAAPPVHSVSQFTPGTMPQCLQGVPADGVVDTAADITIMGGKLFALVASSARLRKKDFKPPDRVPRTYDRKVFHLDGRMDLEVSFQGRAMKTTVYIKMDAPDQLLLSEGVCRQLGIVTYHPSLRLPDEPAVPTESPVSPPKSPAQEDTLVPWCE